MRGAPSSLVFGLTASGSVWLPCGNRQYRRVFGFRINNCVVVPGLLALLRTVGESEGGDRTKRDPEVTALDDEGARTCWSRKI